MSQPLSRLPQPVRWAILIILCGLASQCLNIIKLPGALFIGPMLVSIALSIWGISLHLPKIGFNLGQGVIGILISEALTIGVLSNIASHWALMIVITIITLLLSLPVGLFNVRYGGMPGTTAAWGTSPGAAAAMVAMAEDHGGDPRIVAAMQYVRVLCVVMTGAVVAHIFHTSASAHAPTHIDNVFSWPHLLTTLVLLVVGVQVGRRLIPSGAIIGPILLAAPLHMMGWVSLDLPAPLLSLGYGAIAVYVGLRFDRPTVLYVLRGIPWMVLSSMILIFLCAISAYLMSHFIDSDFLSLYLATSPGGLDSMTIIAIDTQSDVGLVAALQILRLFAVIMAGPRMASFIARFAVNSKG